MSLGFYCVTAAASTSAAAVAAVAAAVAWTEALPGAGRALLGAHAHVLIAPGQDVGDCTAGNRQFVSIKSTFLSQLHWHFGVHSKVCCLHLGDWPERKPMFSYVVLAD